MTVADMFTAEERVPVKVGDLYRFFQQAAENEAKAKYLFNAVCCEVPHRFIREIITGEPETNRQDAPEHLTNKSVVAGDSDREEDTE